MIVTKRVKREAGKLFRWCLTNDGIDESRVRDVVRRTLSASHRDGPSLLAHFLRLVRLERAAHLATIESARLLSAELRAAIQSGLARRYGPGLNTVFSQRPSLIAGVRIQVGCDVYDGSLQARLRALEQSF